MNLLLESKAVLGEGPSWDAVHQLLLWVDILKHEVHFYDPKTLQDRMIDVGDYVGAVVPRASGGYVVALRNGFYHLDPQTERLSLMVAVESDLPNNRFNDGKCDAKGRFWAGTMNLDSETPSGSLYCLDTNLQVRKVVENVKVSNGLGWSPDNKTMYYIDSPTKQVVAFDYDLETGSLDRPSVVIEIDQGFPDGMTVDEEGMIWVAHWDGYQVSRWNPRTGQLLQQIKLPAALVTSCVFAGADLDQLIVTSASRDLSMVELEQQKWEGGLYAARVGVKGLPTYAFQG